MGFQLKGQRHGHCQIFTPIHIRLYRMILTVKFNASDFYSTLSSFQHKFYRAAECGYYPISPVSQCMMRY